MVAQILAFVNGSKGWIWKHVGSDPWYI